VIFFRTESIEVLASFIELHIDPLCLIDLLFVNTRLLIEIRGVRQPCPDSKTLVN
jgi:hypothetical protein